MPRQDGKVAIVTGGGRGIGYEVARHLVRLGTHVIIGTVSSKPTLICKHEHKVHEYNLNYETCDTILENI